MTVERHNVAVTTTDTAPDVDAEQLEALRAELTRQAQDGAAPWQLTATSEAIEELTGRIEEREWAPFAAEYVEADLASAARYWQLRDELDAGLAALIEVCQARADLAGRFRGDQRRPRQSRGDRIPTMDPAKEVLDVAFCALRLLRRHSLQGLVAGLETKMGKGYATPPRPGKGTH